MRGKLFNTNLIKVLVAAAIIPIRVFLNLEVTAETSLDNHSAIGLDPANKDFAEIKFSASGSMQAKKFAEKSFSQK